MEMFTGAVVTMEMRGHLLENMRRREQCDENKKYRGLLAAMPHRAPPWTPKVIEMGIVYPT
jgi:hypothetical protein